MKRDYSTAMHIYAVICLIGLARGAIAELTAVNASSHFPPMPSTEGQIAMAVVWWAGLVAIGVIWQKKYGTGRRITAKEG